MPLLSYTRDEPIAFHEQWEWHIRPCLWSTLTQYSPGVLPRRCYYIPSTNLRLGRTEDGTTRVNFAAQHQAVAVYKIGDQSTIGNTAHTC